MKRIGVFTATRWEQEAVSRAILTEEKASVEGVPYVLGCRGACRVWVFRTGMGPAKAGAVSRLALSAHPFDLAISSGFACALTSAHIGDLLIGTHVNQWPPGGNSSRAGLGHSCSTDWRAAAAASAGRVGLEAQSGRFVSVSQVLWLAEDKQRAAADSGAIGLDMESETLGAAAEERQVPFLVARTASDLLDEDLPLDFNLFATPRTWLRGIGQAVCRPSCLRGLVRLRRQSLIAGDRLTQFMRAFLDDVR